jgi:5-methyltetrahydrofolate--homocysteine methyltransferase
VLTGRDPGAREFLTKYARQAPTTVTSAMTNLDPLRELILRGDKDKIVAALEAELAAGAEPMALLERRLFPAIQEVGEKYQQRVFFLPQLVAAAEAMERGVAFLTPRLEHAGAPQKGTVVLATVKGDVHDIGKKIVGLLLRNYGYRVHDLGRSLDAEAIVSRAAELAADVIGLSALMTTTMTEMPKVLALARQRLPRVKVIVGGAVVTSKYAQEIGADGYAPDSVGAVALVDRLMIEKRK